MQPLEERASEFEEQGLEHDDSSFCTKRRNQTGFCTGAPVRRGKPVAALITLSVKAGSAIASQLNPKCHYSRTTRLSALTRLSAALDPALDPALGADKKSRLDGGLGLN